MTLLCTISRVFGVLAMLGAMMYGVSVLQKRLNLPAEISRKIAHVGMGLIALSFPWLFHDRWPVVAVAAGCIAALIAIRLLPGAKANFGSVLGGVQRTSMGELFFPLAVACLYGLSNGDPILYCAPMLVLTFGDATAALIGVRYGVSRYAAEDGGTKSIEGSIAFFTVTFLCVHIPVLLLTSTGRAQSLLIAVTLGVLAMLIEAIAWSGLDNLFVPLGAYLILRTFLHLSAPALTARLIAILTLVSLLFLWRRRTTLKDTALVGAALACYLCWAIGGPNWLVAPLSLLIAYPIMTPRSEITKKRIHSIASVISVASVGLFWLLVWAHLAQQDIIYAYTLSFAIQLALIGVVRRAHDLPDAGPAASTIASSAVKSWLLLFVPYLRLAPNLIFGGISAAIALGVVWMATVLFYSTDRSVAQRPTDTRLLARQAAFSAAGSIVGLILIRQ